MSVYDADLQGTIPLPLHYVPSSSISASPPTHTTDSQQKSAVNSTTQMKSDLVLDCLAVNTSEPV